ncbi:MAG: trypsin-like peptidase domain-containing protein [Chloroflexi bacterium]|nr:trypsin-like peptidase domain-containing protein [Chloroflexota bacterium]
MACSPGNNNQTASSSPPGGPATPASNPVGAAPSSSNSAPNITTTTSTTASTSTRTVAAAAASSPVAGDPAVAPGQTSAGRSVGTPSGVSVQSAQGGLLTAVRDIAQRVKPAVVQITNQQQIQLQQSTQSLTVPAGVGSGVIYDQSGHILTNNHVVEGAQGLQVSLPDGRSFPATLIGADPQTDLAVVQIQGSNLPVAEIGDSRQLQVGDWVVAIGNALALPGGPTVTQGVVSALGRTVQEPGSSSPGGGPLGGRGPAAQPSQAGPFLFDVIQTDAPINPGNSGGPLVDLNGQVIGINTLVAGQAEPGVSAQGIGFAIAISTARPIADTLVAQGHIDHPYIGIAYVPLTPPLAVQLGTQAKNGAVIGQVVQGSPAAQARLQQRDVITEIDGQPLRSESALAQAITAHKPGDRVTLTIQRGAQQLNVPLTLGTMPNNS